MPIFLGISTRLEPDRGLMLWGHGGVAPDSVPFTTDILREYLCLAGVNVVAINIMHTNFGAITPTLDVVRQVWMGPIGVYPDHGTFEMPNWVFKEVNPTEVRTYVREWIEHGNSSRSAAADGDLCREKHSSRTYRGVNLIGGCCGLGPEYLRLVRDEVKKLQPRHLAFSLHILSIIKPCICIRRSYTVSATT